ncbi:DUF3667 domain-containing protein [Winogradskyella litorisediminis]|uniref:DUF3667 domain-containing protein n=1 Tax=Winogradskyella litorisediminis TaxID=1156618 RepID=A0ABW3N8G8_9FLAO
MNCKNCNKPLLDTQKYCDECGAKVIKNRLTPTVLVHQINEEFISIDNKFLQTFVNLYKNPEDVINRYIDGTRKRYINVLQYFAIGLTLAGIQFYIMQRFFPEQFDFSNIFNQEINESNQSFQEKLNEVLGDGGNFQSFAYIISVPFSAISTWLTYRFTGFKKFNFTEHVVINLYYSGQIIITTSIFYIITSVLGIGLIYSSTIISITTFFYQCYVFKKVTNESSLETFAKIVVSYFVIAIQAVILIVLLVLILVLLKLTNII